MIASILGITIINLCTRCQGFVIGLDPSTELWLELHPGLRLVIGLDQRLELRFGLHPGLGMTRYKYYSS